MTIRHAEKKEVEKLQSLNYEVFIDNHQYDQDLDMTWQHPNMGKNILLR